jgi:hypothetical protein
MDLDIPGVCALLLELAVKRRNFTFAIARDVELLCTDLREANSELTKQKMAAPAWAYRSTEAYQEIVRMYGEEPQPAELLAFARAIARHLPPELAITRQQARKRCAIYQWFEDHWSDILPVLDRVEILPPG